MKNLITDLEKMQARIGTVGLKDHGIPWREKRMQAYDLSKILEGAGFQDYAAKARSCGTSLQFGVDLQSNTKKLQAANFCCLRLCPMCAFRKSRKAAFKLSQVMDRAEEIHGVRFLFLTLAMRNVQGPDLGGALDDLAQGWNRLIQQRPIKRAVVGWFRAVEITRNQKRKSKWHGTYHPHIHAILAVKPEYFERKSGLYLTQADLVERWKMALKVDYKPTVNVKVTYQKSTRKDRSEVLEAAKYPTKYTDMTNGKMSEAESIRVVQEYIPALHGRRMTAFGGVLKEIAAELNADTEQDNDLVHIDRDTIREDVFDLLIVYRWSFGAGDYVLTDVQPKE